MNSIRFMYAAYIATWVILGGYMTSIARRYSHLRQQVRELSRRGK
jgi:CcmD family protein